MSSGIFTREAGELIFHNEIQQSSIDFTRLNIIKWSNRRSKQIIIIGIGKSHNSVLSCAIVTSKQSNTQAIKQRKSERKERAKGKEGE